MRAVGALACGLVIASCTLSHPLDYLTAGTASDGGAAPDGHAGSDGAPAVGRGCAAKTPSPSFCVDFDAESSDGLTDPVHAYVRGQGVLLPPPTLETGTTAALSPDAFSAPRAFASTVPAAGSSSLEATLRTPTIDVGGHAVEEASVKLAKPGAGETHYHVLSTFEASTGLKVFLSVQDGAPRLSIAHGTGDAGDAHTFGGVAFPTDQWTRVHVTIDTEPPQIVARLSIDGVAVGSAAVDAPSITGTMTLTFGLTAQSGSAGTSLLMDDVVLDAPR